MQDFREKSREMQPESGSAPKLDVVARLGKYRTWIKGVNPILEVFVVMAVVLVVTWIWMPIAITQGNKILEYAGLGVLAIVLAWMSFISHWVRGEKFHDLGGTDISHFLENARTIRHSRGQGNFSLFAGILLVMFLLFTTNIIEVTGQIPFFNEINASLIQVLDPVGIFTVAVIEYLVLLSLLLLFVLKWENAKQSFMAHVKYMNPFVLVLFVIAVVFNSEKVESIGFMEAVSAFTGYIFWAVFQQVPFMAYINTQFRKGFDILYPDVADRKKNVVCAFFTAILFAIVHFPAWILSIIAFFMQFLLSLVYYNPRTRNLFITAVFHALVGVMVIKFFDINLIAGYIALFQSN